MLLVLGERGASDTVEILVLDARASAPAEGEGGDGAGREERGGAGGERRVFDVGGAWDVRGGAVVGCSLLHGCVLFSRTRVLGCGIWRVGSEWTDRKAVSRSMLAWDL